MSRDAPERKRSKPDVLLVWALILGTSTIPVFLFSPSIWTHFGLEWSTAFGIGLSYSTAAVAIACALLALGVQRQPIAPKTRAYLAIMGFLAGLAPLCVVLFYRLSIRSCPVMNLLGLPWPEPLREIVRIASGVVLLLSLMLTVYGLFQKRYRVSAIAIAVFYCLMAIPTFVFMFLLVFGDPGPNCTVG